MLAKELDHFQKNTRVYFECNIVTSLQNMASLSVYGYDQTNAKGP